MAALYQEFTAVVNSLKGGNDTSIIITGYFFLSYFIYDHGL